MANIYAEVKRVEKYKKENQIEQIGGAVQRMLDLFLHIKKMTKFLFIGKRKFLE